MFGNHTHRSQGIQEPEGRRIQRDHYGEIVRCNSTVHKGQVNGPHGSLGCFQCEGDILCRDLLAIGKISILPNFESPHQAVLRQAIVCSQIVDERHVRIVTNQGALHNRGIAMAPAFGGIQSSRFIANGNNDGISNFRRCCFCNRFFFCPAGYQTQNHNQYHQQCSQFLSVHIISPCFYLYKKYTLSN